MLHSLLDDDEAAEPYWLQALYDCMHHYDCDIVIGKVSSEFLPDLPDWARTHAFFNLPAPKTGTFLKTGYSGNVLLRRSAFDNLLLRFDEKYTRTGGEDADFFHRAHEAGCSIVFCREANVLEHVPAERTCLEWVKRRAFRTGRAYSSVYIRPLPRLRRLSWAISKLVHSLAVAPLLPVARVMNYRIYVELLTSAHSSLGHLAEPTDLARDRSEYNHLRPTSASTSWVSADNNSLT